MIKDARKASNDPVQEKLRQNKVVWNHKVSAFIEAIKYFKKLMNGYPNKFHSEKSLIQNPIPANPTGIISALVSQFNEIAEDGNDIIKEQLEYSINRKKRQSKNMSQVNLPTGSKPSDLSKQLSLPSVASYDYDLIAEASNPFSRFFSKLKNPAVGFGSAADLRRTRMSMLKDCAAAYKKLGKFQSKIVGATKSSIHEANKLLEESDKSWKLVSRVYVEFKKNKYGEVHTEPDSIESQTNIQDLKDQRKLENLDKDEELPEQQSNIDLTILRVKLKMQDFISNNKHLPKVENVLFTQVQHQLNDMAEKFLLSKKTKINENFENLYDKSISILNGIFSTTGISYKEIISQLTSRIKKEINKPKITEKTSSNNEIEKLAQAFLKKWVGKTYHQLNPIDDTSTYRISCYKGAVEIRKEINEIMNILEKDLDESKLDPLIKNVNSRFTSIRGIMRNVNRFVEK